MLFCLCLLTGRPEALAQAPSSSATAVSDTTRGIDLYQQGNNQGAIEALRRVVKKEKDDLSAWHYLGLALNRQGKKDDARKAHEKAAKIGETLLLRQYESASFKLISLRLVQLKLLAEEAADSADKYLELSSKPSKKKVYEWQERAEFLREFTWLAEHTAEDSTYKIYAPKDVTTKARILSKAEPQYTEEARKNQVTGTVVLKAVFAEDGRVRGIRPVVGLPYGLTTNAVRAARQIKFVPAMLNGVPVSQYIQIEYNFNLY
jgi:TonB family protein